MYKLALYYDNNDFDEPSDYIGGLEKNLKDIVEFTNTFGGDDALKEYLAHFGKIKSTEGEFAINFYKNKKSKPVRLDYGVPFASEAKYFNPDTITNYICAKFINEDFMSLFSEKFMQKFINVEYFRNDLLRIDRDYNIFLEEKYLPFYYVFDIENFVKKYTHKKDKDGNVKINARRLFEIAMFIIDYERKSKEPEQKTISDNIERLEQTKAELKYYKMLLTKNDIDSEQKEAYEHVIQDREKKLVKGEKNYGTSKNKYSR